jgi:hypothetical protein
MWRAGIVAALIEQATPRVFELCGSAKLFTPLILAHWLTSVDNRTRGGKADAIDSQGIDLVRHASCGVTDQHGFDVANCFNVAC